MIRIEGNEKNPDWVFIPDMEDELHQVADASTGANGTTKPNTKPPKASTAPNSIAKLSAIKELTLDDLIEAEYRHTGVTSQRRMIHGVQVITFPGSQAGRG